MPSAAPPSWSTRWAPSATPSVYRNPKKVDAAHQRLDFIGCAPWNDRAARRVAAKYAVDVMTEREPVEAWIIDDTGFLKQGSHSVGVQRQYTGSAGKVTN
jgi:SRSO17 transposase